MRIAHVTDCYLPRTGGIERQVHGLASAQQVLGHDVEIITSVPAGRTDPGGQFVVHRPASRSFGRDRTPKTIAYRSSLRGRRTLLDGGYDVVHVHASTFSPLAYLAARATAGRIPTALTLHSLWAQATPIFLAADTLLGWRRWPIAWSAVSTVAVRDLRAVLGNDTAVSVLPNAVTPELWRLPHARESRPGELRVISTMRLAGRKRPVQFLHMMRALRSRLPSGLALKVTIIGDGPLAPRLRDFLLDFEMTEWVELLGELTPEQIKHQYERADVYVSPARLESFGIAALEARCAGLPIVAFSDTGAADYIRHGTNGLLTGSDRDMVHALAALALSPETRASITRHNRNTAPSQTWFEVTEAAEGVYQRAREATTVPLPGRAIGATR